MNHTVDTPTFLPSSNPRVPKAEQPFRHCMPMQIRFTDIDMMGHLNNNVYLTFMDLAKIDYFTTLRPGEVDMNNLNMVVVPSEYLKNIQAKMDVSEDELKERIETTKLIMSI